MECCFHPGEVVIGICALCLNERLLLLASRRDQKKLHRIAYKRRNPINLPNILALASLLNRLDLRHTRSQHHQSESEDSFISIKFGDNGSASWEKTKVPPNPEVPIDHRSTKTMALNDGEEDGKAVNEHPIKASLRWRKRIGHIFQLTKYWKKPRHVGKKLDRVKVRHGWIRGLTKKRTN